MKTIKINLYTFAELSDKAKKKVLESFHDINTDFDQWNDYLIDQFKEELQEIGFEGAEIQYSGFWSQGDGLSFDAEINLKKFNLSARLLAIAEDCNFCISQTGFANHYSHEKTRYIEFDETGRENIDSALQDVCKNIEGLRLQLCRKFYRTLEKEYDSLVSDAAIIDTIEANEYLFNESGKIQHYTKDQEIKPTIWSRLLSLFKRDYTQLAVSFALWFFPVAVLIHGLILKAQTLKLI